MPYRKKACSGDLKLVAERLSARLLIVQCGQFAFVCMHIYISHLYVCIYIYIYPSHFNCITINSRTFLSDSSLAFVCTIKLKHKGKIQYLTSFRSSMQYLRSIYVIQVLHDAFCEGARTVWCKTSRF